MTPESYTGDENNVVFHYSFSELRKFIEHGRNEGNNGFIIVSKIDNLMTYRGYGTIENPSRSLFRLTKVYFPLWDGKFSIEAIMTKPTFNKDDYSYKVIDLSKPLCCRCNQELTTGEVIRKERSIGTSTDIKKWCDKCYPKRNEPWSQSEIYIALTKKIEFKNPLEYAAMIFKKADGTELYRQIGSGENLRRVYPDGKTVYLNK